MAINTNIQVTKCAWLVNKQIKVDSISIGNKRNAKQSKEMPFHSPIRVTKA